MNIQLTGHAENYMRIPRLILTADIRLSRKNETLFWFVLYGNKWRSSECEL